MAKNTVGMEVKPILLALLRHLLHSLTVNSGAFRALVDCQTNDAENCHKVSSILATVEYGDSEESFVVEMVKFTYSEKATKFEKNLPLI